MDEFSAFLAQHPELTDIVTSRKYIEMMEYLSKNTKTIEELCKTFRMNAAEIGSILNKLIETNLVDKIKIKNNFIYKISLFGEEVLDLYKSFKKNYSLD